MGRSTVKYSSRDSRGKFRVDFGTFAQCWKQNPRK